MFARLFSRWKCCPPPGETGDEERRIWVRYDYIRETTIQSGNGKEHLPSQAQIRDVSRGGVQLILTGPVKEGELLSLHIPTGSAETSTILACVVWVQQKEDDLWVAGCSFSSELTDEDLEHFGARRSRSAPPDKRGWVRFPCQTQVFVQKVRAREKPPQATELVDISANGLGVRTAHTARVGELLTVEFRGQDDRVLLSTLASVVRVTDRVDGQHLLGCNFIRELSEEELNTLF
jgi:c-di-GMP-binding flagellar brake protein YcgR